MKTQFQKDLIILINQHCKENDSDTPDFILAKYLNAVLENFNAAVKQREEWYGRQKHLSDLHEAGENIPSDISFPIPPPIDYNNTGTPPENLKNNHTTGTSPETNLSNYSSVMKTSNAKNICEGPSFEEGV